MSFESFCSQRKVVQSLQTAIKHHRVAHAYIFAGSKGTGKRAMALEFAKAMNCERDHLNPCDECPTCKQIQSGNHPDVVTIRPEGTVIKIEQIRQLQQRFRFQAAEGMTRVVIMEEADQMRDVAANSLLKFLEEPTSPMIAILLTEQVKHIIQTVRSRCQIVRFAEPSVQDRTHLWLQRGIDSQMAYVLAQCSSEIDDLEWEQDQAGRLFQHIITWAKSLISRQLSALVAIQEPWFQELTNQKNIALILDLLIVWLRYVSRVGVGVLDPMMKPFEEDALGQAKRRSQADLLQMIEHVMIARKLSSRPELSNQSVIEQMVIEIQRGVSSDWSKISY